MNNISNLNAVNLNKVDTTESIMISGRTSAAQAAKISSAEKNVQESLKAEESKVRTDTIELSGEKTTDVKSETGIYSREALLEQLKEAEAQRVKAFEDTIRSMAAQQGQVINFTFRGQGLHVTEEQRKAAEESISEGGEYSVNSVADRIMKMAEVLSGGDSSKIALLREAVQKGFGAAMKDLGIENDNAPQITKDTYNEIMTRFDKWEASFNKTEEEAVTESQTATTDKVAKETATESQTAATEKVAEETPTVAEQAAAAETAIA
ncbi:MAG: hypothetical protein IJN85_06055 [Oscillospiraceae bacterium]|nr:hypothetical protein [Oscillospiraceae bacterium]